MTKKEMSDILKKVEKASEKHSQFQRKKRLSARRKAGLDMKVKKGGKKGEKSKILKAIDDIKRKKKVKLVKKDGKD